VRAIELHRMIVFARVRVQEDQGARLCGKAPGPGETRAGNGDSALQGLHMRLEA
jgi:hypothetical protein